VTLHQDSESQVSDVVLGGYESLKERPVREVADDTEMGQRVELFQEV
jgi:hypothetical protein